MVETVTEIKEPLHGYTQELALARPEELKVIEIQRKPSEYHVRRLAESIRRVGFVTPLTAIRSGGSIVVIDGQHRLLAAKEAGVTRLPLVIIPEEYAHRLMELNVEKQMSLREKAYVALNVYRMYLSEDDSTPEDDPKILDSIEHAYYVTLGMAYERNQRLFGSAYESLLRRLDGFFSLPLSRAVEVRGRRADIVLEVDDVARRAVERVKELGITHPFLHREVVSFCSPIGRRRKLTESMEEVFGKLKENLRLLEAEPERIRAHKFSEEAYQP